jgi:hypothetical protein
MKIYASQKNVVEAQHEARSNEQINIFKQKITTPCSDKIKHYYKNTFLASP